LGLSMVVQRLINLERRAGREERGRLAERVRELEAELAVAKGVAAAAGGDDA